MSLQHHSLAEVWTYLQGRHDISNILREILGQHAVNSSLQEDVSQNVEESVQTVVWIKTIFDLQRAYLSGTASGVSECPPYVLSCLLPSELLLSTIMFLINVKSRLFPSQTTLVTREFTRQRLVLAQTILSGLRLLLLRKETISFNDKRRLQNAINSAWQLDRLNGVERFVVSDLMASALDGLNESRAVNAYQHEWRLANLPTFAAGLYPLEIMPETFVTPLIHGTMEEDWQDAYWVLFDCLWAVEAAVTQRFVDLRGQSAVTGYSQLSIDTDEMLEHLYQTRTSLITTIFQNNSSPMTSEPSLLDSLAITLLEWNEDLESFLSRQDSLMNQRPTLRPEPSRSTSYARRISEISIYLERGQRSFLEWLSNRRTGYEQISISRSSVTPNDLQEIVREWLVKMSSANVETLTRDLEGPLLPVYVVDCPNLHTIPKKLLEYKLRWIDKWAYESIQDNTPICRWKEGIPCPSCNSGEKIKTARLLEPLQTLSFALEHLNSDDYSLRQYSSQDSGSYDTTSASAASESESVAALSIRSHSTLALGSIPSQTTSSNPTQPNPTIKVPFPSSGRPPSYSESPVSPTSNVPGAQNSLNYYLDSPVSPFTESLNIPIAMNKRISMDLPIPVLPPSLPEVLPTDRATSAPSEASSSRLNTASSTESTWSVGSIAKMKSPSRTYRLASSIRRKPTTKEKERETYPLPQNPSFLFSSSGHSLLLWGRGGDYLIRFDIPINDISSIQGCKYELPGIEAAAAGNHKCVIMATSGQKRRLVVYSGINLAQESEIELESKARVGDICLAVSRNDKFAATSFNDQIQIYSLEDGIRTVSFHHQIHVYELRGGHVHRRTVPVGRTKSSDSIDMAEPSRTDTGWFGVDPNVLSTKEVAEEQQRQSAVISRKIYFSPDGTKLVVATVLGDHCVYVDLWDCMREPVSTISEHSRSFKLPPWTLNDGDLTSIFYDTLHRSAILTAFLGKEYPVLIPFPGFDDLSNEQYSTKVVHAAQSPSGVSFVTANAMSEIIQFEYTAKGTLFPRKLKKASSRMSTSIFKPGSIIMAMPLENVLQEFWIRDGKCMLRTVKLGSQESSKDYDIRPHFERLMSLKNNPVIARAPTLRIPELGGGD